MQLVRQSSCSRTRTPCVNVTPNQRHSLVNQTVHLCAHEISERGRGEGICRQVFEFAWNVSKVKQHVNNCLSEPHVGPYLPTCITISAGCPTFFCRTMPYFYRTWLLVSCPDAHYIRGRSPGTNYIILNRSSVLAVLRVDIATMRANSLCSFLYYASKKSRYCFHTLIQPRLGYDDCSMQTASSLSLGAFLIQGLS